MSSTATYETFASEPVEDRSLEYRALHSGAITGAVLGVASIFVLVTALSSDLSQTMVVAPIPLVGIFFSLRALGQISREKELYTGQRFALAGLALSAFFLLSGVGYAGFVHMTEVPEGYTRLSYTAMKPSDVDQRGDKVVPDEIAALDGQKVFIKGYIRPDSLKVRKNAKGFLLVRDNNTCCFGDMSKVKYFDQILVAMQGGLSVDYSTRLFRMGGTLHIHPQNVAQGPKWPVFSMEADYVK